jgi:hypothetical protein
VTIFTFFSVSPEVEYYYSKPLSSGEYTYFKLKEDIRQSSLIVYGSEEKTNMQKNNKILLYTKDYFKDGDLECFPVCMAQFF